MEFDEALPLVGEFGRFQVLNYALLLLPAAHTAMFMMFVFAARDLPYRCHVPECDDVPGAAGAVLDPPWLSWAVPPSTVPRPWPPPGGPARAPDTCLRYAALPAPGTAAAPGTASTCWPEYFDTNRTERCDRWVFPEEDNTIVSEFQITCEENRWKLTIVGSLNFLGELIGMPFGGVFSDRFGRRTLLLVAMPLSFAAGISRSFVTSYDAFLALTFVDAFFAAGLYSAVFILGVELVAGRQRVIGSSLVASFFSLGWAALGAVAWWQRDWRWLLRVAYVPAGLAVLLVWLLPESVRWLLSRGRTREAEAILKRVAAVNGVSLSTPLELRSTKVIPSAPAGPAGPAAGLRRLWDSPLLQVCRSSLLMRRLVLTAFIWIVTAFVYFGLALFSVALAGDLYLNFILAGLVEIPSYVVAWALSDRWGRRGCVSSSLGVTSGSLLAYLIIPDGLEPLRLALYLTAKLSITTTFTVLYVFTAELFPTSARHSMIGLCSTVGRIGSVLAPQLPLLEVFFWGMPLLVLAVTCFAAACVTLVLPETLNAALPDTVSEAKAMGRPAVRPAPAAARTAPRAPQHQPLV
ncbi:Solute carrier family 22 member 5 [Frankliniella fusca]|uniref:Solute carrier family 22 member 5 n=1 Tax=Frankliniella fusca TaxID=407009 RepID=A0AAE1HPX4_9NEOP|nr:Solute carrier family 22 member 5 [Frankliniella fusca]